MRKIGNKGQANFGAIAVMWIIILVIMFILSIAMENPRTLFLGGKMDIDVQPGKKVVYVQPHIFYNFWVMTREMREDEKPEVIVFKENSWFGIFQGTITLRESRKEGEKR